MRSPRLLATLAVGLALSTGPLSAQSLSPSTTIDAPGALAQRFTRVVTDGHTVAGLHEVGPLLVLDFYERSASGTFSNAGSKAVAGISGISFVAELRGTTSEFAAGRIAHAAAEWAQNIHGTYVPSFGNAAVTTWLGSGATDTRALAFPVGLGPGGYATDLALDETTCVVAWSSYVPGALPTVPPTVPKSYVTFHRRNASGDYALESTVDLTGTGVLVRGVAVDGDAAVVCGSSLTGGAGFAQVYERSGGGTWSFAQDLATSDPGASTNFYGRDCDIEGDRAVVVDQGASENGVVSGAAYVFERPAGSSGATWSETAKLVRPGAVGGESADSVSLSGPRVLIEHLGASVPSSDVFVVDPSGAWQHEVELVVSAGTTSHGRTGALDGSLAVLPVTGPTFPARIDVFDLDSLVGFGDTISCAAGGEQRLALRPGSARAGQLYFLFGSITGTSPGYPVPNTPWTLPLNLDVYFEFTTWTLFGGGLLAQPNGSIDADGGAETSFAVWPAFPQVFAGFTVHHAYVLLDLAAPGAPVSFVSSPSSVTLVP
ncbi:MAG: FG-GAP repeat protein [Planctomycetota bacterium]